MKYSPLSLKLISLVTLILESSHCVGSDEYIVASRSPISDRIVFSAQGGRVLEYDANTQKLRPIIDDCNSPLDPSYSSDEQSILFSERIDDSVWGLIRLDIRNRTKQKLTKGFYDRYPRDIGKNSIIFTRATGLKTDAESWAICLLEEPAMHITRITAETYFRIDGMCIVGDDLYFTARKLRSDLMDLFVVRDFGKNAPAHAEKPIENSIRATRASNVTTDGELLLFASDVERRFNYDLMIYDIDREKLAPLGLTSSFRISMSPMFSLDRRMIFFLASEGFSTGNKPEFGLWTANSDGTNPRQLLDANSFGGNRNKVLGTDTQ